MRSINASIQTQLETGQLIAFGVLEMYINSVYYRYTNCEVPIAVDSKLFTPRRFEVSDLVYSQGLIIESMKVDLLHLDTAQDYDEVSTLTGVFINNDPQGTTVTYSLVVLNPSNLTPLGSVSFPLFSGLIGTWTLSEDTIQITVNSSLDQWSQRTLTIHPPSCRWKVFKGTECGYAGVGTSCDRSYTQCNDYSNTANFGGFRWLPSIVDKPIWWGKETSFVYTGGKGGGGGGGRRILYD